MMYHSCHASSMISDLLFHPSLENLTPRQKQFVIYRITDPLAPTSRLALAAGYRPSTITSNGGRVLKSAKIRQALREIWLERSLGY